MLPLYENAPPFEESLAFFKGLGLAPMGFYPITIDHRHQLLDCDCVYVNPSRITASAVEKY